MSQRYYTPAKKGKWFASENKEGKHKSGPKNGKALTKSEKGYRAGYTAANRDHAEVFKYKNALEKGYTKEEAKLIAKQKYDPQLPRKN